jgi:hypothetical protein
MVKRNIAGVVVHGMVVFVGVKVVVYYAVMVR